MSRLCTLFSGSKWRPTSKRMTNVFMTSIKRGATTSIAGENKDSYHDQMYKLMDENNTDKLYIKFNGYMSNHTSHGLYALDRLDAPLKVAERFVELQNQNLDDAKTCRERELNENLSPSSEKLLGAHTSFYFLRENYGLLLNNIYDGSVEKLIVAEFPKLSQGMIGAAFHGLIHLGYACATRRPWYVLEGLAYLHYSYLPINLSHRAPNIETLGLGSVSILDVMGMVRSDKELCAVVSEMKDDFSTTARAAALCSDVTRADQLANYVNMIQFPQSISAPYFRTDNTAELMKWLIDCAIIVYTIAENKNGFFLLHGVTSSWALRNLLLLLDDRDLILHIARKYMCCLLAIYIIQGCPKLETSVITNNEGMTKNWKDLVRLAIANDDYYEGDPHVYKLIQVCKDMSAENDDSTMESIYRLASHLSVTNKFSF